MQQIRQLGRELNSSRTSSDDDKAKKPRALGLRLLRIACALDGVDDRRTDASGINDLLQEVSVLFNAGRVEGLVLCPNGHKQLIVLNVKAGANASSIVDGAARRFAARCTSTRQRFRLGVEVQTLGLNKLDVGEDRADGFDDGPRLDRPDGHRRQQRGHQKIVARRNAYYLVFKRVDVR